MATFCLFAKGQVNGQNRYVIANGIARTIDKSSFIEIPEEMKIFRGDDWLFYQNKAIGRQNYYIEGGNIYHYGSLSSRSKALRPIGRVDRKIYRSYFKKWYHFFYDKEEFFDGYRLTVLGHKSIHHTGNKKGYVGCYE